MEEKYIIEDEDDYMKVVLLTEEQAKAIGWVFNVFDCDITITKVDEYTALSIT